MKAECSKDNLLGSGYSISLGSGTAIQLSSRISSADAACNIASASHLARELCQHIDGEISPLLNKLAGTRQMRFTLALAGYRAYLQAVMYLNLAQALESFSVELDGKVVTCSDAPLNELIHSRFQLTEVVGRLLQHNRVEVRPVSALPMPSASLFQKFYRKVLLVKNSPSKAFDRMLRGCRVFGIHLMSLINMRRSHKNGRILMFFPYCSLYDFGANCFGQYELLLCSERSFDAAKIDTGRSEFSLLAENLCSQARADEKLSVKNVVYSLLVDDILQELDYCLWDKNYLGKLIFLRQMLEERPVSLGIWCIPPVFCFDSLIFEYLMSCRMPVIGNQHGGLNGCQRHVEMMLVDFLRCTDFVSWGSSKEDVERLYPQEQVPCRIHPLGWSRAIRNAIKQEKDFDLLFPLTNTLHMFNGGMLREKPELLLEKQIRLLEYLDGLSEVRIAVKPFPGANQWNCGVYDRLMKLRNVKVFWDISLVSFIGKYCFRGVLFEHPSTPLYEVLNLDVEIFMHLDSVLKIESLAFEELERRAYCFSNVDRMTQTIDAFLAGKLPQRRDDHFYQHYVSRPETKENFLSLVRRLQNRAQQVDHFEGL